MGMKSCEPKTSFNGHFLHYSFPDERRCRSPRAPFRALAPKAPNPGSSFSTPRRAITTRRALPIRRWEELAFEVPLARVGIGTRPSPPALV
jgi:hypothetical protein